MAVFIEHPVFAAAIGIVLLVVGRPSRRRLVSGVGVAWLLYALYEYGMKRRWLCSGECNIRIDLLVIYPVLLVASLAAMVGLLRPPPAGRSGPRAQ